MSSKPTHEAIKLHAFHLWERAVDKRDPLHWYYLAEAELKYDWHRLPRIGKEGQRRFYLSL